MLNLTSLPPGHRTWSEIHSEFEVGEERPRGKILLLYSPDTKLFKVCANCSHCQKFKNPGKNRGLIFLILFFQAQEGGVWGIQSSGNGKEVKEEEK